MTVPTSVRAERLVWSKDATVRLAASGELEIMVGVDSHYVSRRALDVFALAAEPITREKLFDQLPAETPVAYIETAQLVNMLYDSGILVGEDAVSAPPAGGFDAPPIHAAMLNDTERVHAYERAIAEVVTPDDIVLDIGTGTGVLAALAARAGARHVYAVEEGRIGEAARRTFEASPWRDRLTLLQGRSTKLTTPEPATVVVSEILGHDPFDEGILTIYRDAAHRLTSKGARWIPSRIDLFAALVELPAHVLRDDTFCEENLERWSTAYDIPFQTLRQYEEDSPYAINVKALDFLSWQLLSDPVRLVSQDLTTIEHTEIEARAKLIASRNCSHVGVMTYFDAILSPSVTLSTAPSTDRARTHTSNHWKYRVYVCGSRKRVAQGEHVEICYQHGSDPTTISFC